MEEIKKKVKSVGTVYGEVWYQAEITLPKVYKEIKYTEKLEKLNVHRHENINFEDFILFAKTTRKVAKEIYNNIQLDYEKILLKNKNKFARYKNNKNKFI